MGIRKGSRIEFIVEADGDVRMRAATSDIRALCGFVRWTGKPLTQEDLDRAIAEGAARGLPNP